MELFDFLGQYRCLFFDAYGVLNDATAKYPYALKVLERIGKNPKVRSFLVTNDSATPIMQLAARWSPFFNDQTVVSSGKTIDVYMIQNPSISSVVILGPTQAKEVFTRPNLSVLTTKEWSRDQDNKIDAFAVLSSVGYDWHEALNTALKVFRLNPDCKLIAPNPDLIYSINDHERGIAAGSLALLLHNACGKPIHWLGKPYQEIFVQAYARASEDIKDLKKSEVLMIGDTLATDIAGAQRFGIDTLYVKGGVGGGVAHQDLIVPTATVKRLELGQTVEFTTAQH